MNLRKRWFEVVKRHTHWPDQEIDVRWMILEKFYEGRPYHNLRHIQYCLTQLDSVKNELSNFHFVNLEFAIWWHDAIYIPGSNSNELDSYYLFYSCFWDMGEINSLIVKENILATSQHGSSEPPGTMMGKFMMDIDLSGLGKDYDNFYTDNLKICDELRIDRYDPRRFDFLKSLTSRDRIYWTAFFNTKYEVKARSNIQRLINEYK